jgi:hypothetical protein
MENAVFTNLMPALSNFRRMQSDKNLNSVAPSGLWIFSGSVTQGCIRLPRCGTFGRMHASEVTVLPDDLFAALLARDPT